MARLAPSLIRGGHLDFFVQRSVTQIQFLVMVAIHAQPRCTMGALARGMHVALPTATGVVGRLVRDGYARRGSAPKDRRQVVVELTAKGRAFIEQFQSVVQRRWEEVLRPLSSSELTTFSQIIGKLLTHFERSS